MTLAESQVQPPGPGDVVAAAERIKGVAQRTPLLEFAILNAATGARVFVKPEGLQRTGSFKIRGAANRIAALSDQERRSGVVAFSSGNHAQGVAEAARLMGVAATIVMPADAPQVKTDGVLSRGARVVAYDRDREDREEIARAICAETGATLIPSYDDPYVIAGQGTVGLEIAEDMQAQGLTLDALVCCAGGCGLMSGIALGLEARGLAPALYTAEPDGFDDSARSWRAGARRLNARAGGSACDALLSPSPGVLPFAILNPRRPNGLVVTDAEAWAGVVFAARRLGLVLEPGGAAALAAVLLGKADFRGRTIAVVTTGSNVDPGALARVLAHGPTAL